MAMIEDSRDGLAQELELGRLVTPPPAWALERPEVAEKLRRPGRVALTGGIAAGKSTLADLFEGWGTGHIDFDVLARRVVAPGTPGLKEAAALFGPEALTPAGELNRFKIAAKIFSEPELKISLENIIHPRAWELMAEELERLESCPVVMISVPLLFEAGLETFFPTIVLIFAGAAIRARRLLARRPDLDQAGAERIMASQWPDPPKVMGATYVIDNSTDLPAAMAQAETVWRAITARVAH
jgi:dephospho-CoA kinase